MKSITIDQIRLADNRFPHKLRSSIESSIWQEVGTENSVVLQYKLDYLEVLSTLIKKEVEEGANNLPYFDHYKSEIEKLNTRDLGNNKIVRIIFENQVIGALIEAFLMETTSILDIMARISSRYLNASFNRFDKSGQKILNHLKQNCGKFENQKELITLIENHKKAWIESVFKLRVDVSHYRNLPYLFSFYIDIDNKWDGKGFDNRSLTNPAIGELDLVEFIELVNSNLLSFVTEYLKLSIGQ